jgi:RNA polymerase sigma-70 factor, ECF subfamily
MERLAIFNQYRPLLLAIAYRMLGRVGDAEDLVQETWIRWQLTETTVTRPKAFLSSIIIRLCIDRLRASRRERERYIGVWLPEPLLTDNHSSDRLELAESLSFAFLILLECLSPTERAVFLMREVFDYDYSEIAKIVGKTIPNCRQIFCRARQHLVSRKSSIEPSLEQKQEIIERFLTSWNQGDLNKLIALMAEDVTLWSDGGGRVTAALQPLYGSQKVARFLVAIQRSRLTPQFISQLAQINYQPGILNLVGGKTQSTFCFEFSNRSIQNIFAVVNPDKLTRNKYYTSAIAGWGD